jgi:hypothetical protein
MTGGVDHDHDHTHEIEDRLRRAMSTTLRQPAPRLALTSDQHWCRRAPALITMAGLLLVAVTLAILRIG